jgi:hypothetical protein
MDNRIEDAILKAIVHSLYQKSKGAEICDLFNTARAYPQTKSYWDFYGSYNKN